MILSLPATSKKRREIDAFLIYLINKLVVFSAAYRENTNTKKRDNKIIFVMVHSTNLNSQVKRYLLYQFVTIQAMHKDSF